MASAGNIGDDTLIVVGGPTGLSKASFVQLLLERTLLKAGGSSVAHVSAFVRRKPMTGLVNFIGDVGREREHLSMPSFCDVVMHADFSAWRYLPDR